MAKEMSLIPLNKYIFFKSKIFKNMLRKSKTKKNILRRGEDKCPLHGLDAHSTGIDSIYSGSLINI